MRDFKRESVNYRKRQFPRPAPRDEEGTGRPQRRGRGDDRPDRRDFKRRDDRQEGSELVMYDITCARCGRESQVPFKPTSSRPVLCRDCFNKEGGSDRPADTRRDGRSRRPEGQSSELEEINRKLDLIMKALKIR